MPRFLFFNQHYAPDVASTGQHLTDLAESLVAKGHQVEVVASRSDYNGGRLDAPRREVRNGVEVRRIRSTSFGRGRNLGRVIDYASFHARIGFEAIIGRKRPDVVVTLTTPPLLGLWGEWMRRFRGAKHVCFLMDLHPDAEIALGMLKADSWLGKILRAGQRMPINRSTKSVVLGPYMGARLIADGVDPERLTTIPIWGDGEELSDVGDTEAWRAERGWTDKFVVMYSGNAGRVHRFGELQAAAEALETRAPDVHFAFVGGGPQRPALEAWGQNRPNVSFHPYVDRRDLGTSLASADVHFASLDPVAAGVSVPGKIIGILGASLPIVFVGPAASESFETVRASGAGIALEPGGDVAEAILALRDDRELTERARARGRAWFLEHHERGVVCERWRALLEELSGHVEAARVEVSV